MQGLDLNQHNDTAYEAAELPVLYPAIYGDDEEIRTLACQDENLMCYTTSPRHQLWWIRKITIFHSTGYEPVAFPLSYGSLYVVPQGRFERPTNDYKSFVLPLN